MAYATLRLSAEQRADVDLAAKAAKRLAGAKEGTALDLRASL